MAQFERMPEIAKSIRTFLLDYAELKAIVDTRIFYFRTAMPSGKEPKVPFIFFRRAGGVYGSYRYYFSVRAKNATDLSNLRRMVIRRLLSPVNLTTEENVLESRLDGQLSDGGDEGTGWYESNFYIIFELLEAQYG